MSRRGRRRRSCTAWQMPRFPTTHPARNGEGGGTLRPGVGDRETLEAAAQHTPGALDATRPTDFVKISNALAALGLQEPGLRDAFSQAAIPIEATAQQFRDAVNPVTVGCLWNESVAVYLMERFRRIFITARPQHLMKAYEAAVVCRVQRPQVWRSLSHEAKQFYVRLSQRHIPDPGREPSAMHWDVSEHLAGLGEAHRNSFRWGPFHVDIGLDDLEEDERRRCLMVDTPTSFFLGSDQYLPTKRLQHEMLASLGWDVRRVRWDDWADLELDTERKKGFLSKLLDDSQRVGEELVDRSPASPSAVRQRLWKFREVQVQKVAEQAQRDATQKIDFDLS